MTKTKSGLTPNQIPFPCHAKIEGPKTLFQKIHKHLPALEKSDLLYVWLDIEDVIVGFEHLGLEECELNELCIETPPACGTRSKLVVICRADSKETAREIAQKVKYSGLEPLDVLICTSERWWSHICTNEECCPKEGRPIDERRNRPKQPDEVIQNRHEVWFKWLDIIEKHQDSSLTISLERDTEMVLRDSLNDLAIRDCVLSHVAVASSNQRTWRRLIEHLITNGRTENNHVLYCLLAAISMSENERDRADFFTRQAILLEPNYSLSVLLQHGLEMKMATPRIISAFTHFSVEDLIERTPRRKN